MTVAEMPETPFEARALARTLATFRAHGKLDVAFGGRALAGGSALKITQMCGTRTRSLANLVVGNGAGIGAKALASRRPVAVTNYLANDGFTHAYDHAVRPESLVTVAALPVVVDRAPRLVVYLAARSQIRLGTAWFDSFAPLLRKVEHDIAVDDEVRRRLALMSASSSQQTVLSRGDLRDMSHELADLASSITDETLRARVEAVRSRCDRASTPTPVDAVTLTPRELDVLRAVARGATNQAAADSLGLLPNTVKAYLKSAMRKLHAANRVQAVTTARDAGLLG